MRVQLFWLSDIRLEKFYGCCSTHVSYAPNRNKLCHKCLPKKTKVICCFVHLFNGSGHLTHRIISNKMEYLNYKAEPSNELASPLLVYYSNSTSKLGNEQI